MLRGRDGCLRGSDEHLSRLGCDAYLDQNLLYW